MSVQYKRVAVDSETDPFLYGRKPTPFVWDVFDGEKHRTFWGADATAQFLAWLDVQTENLEIWAHNGGKFDWMFLLDRFGGDVKTINGRIVRAFYKRHLFRDSFANMPVPLKSFKPANGVRKKDIDIRLMEAGKREANRAEILDYLKADTETLHAAVEAWHVEFQGGLTMAGAAMRQLSLTLTNGGKGRGFDTLTKQQDATYRAFFYGGRVQAFEHGVIREDLKYFDFNSAYPAAMRNHTHPIGNQYLIGKELTDITDFIDFEGWSDGALPVKGPNGLMFPKGDGRFHATGHEIRAAIKLGRVRIKRVLASYTCNKRTNFKPFIDKFWMLRKQAKADGDAMGDLFYKLVMNGAYGRFALNPDKFSDERFCFPGERPTGDDWFEIARIGDTSVWRRRSLRADKAYLNVSTAASITGATRAALLYALHLSERPLYCDTDAVVCRDMDPSVGLGNGLGEMKLEHAGTKMAIAGKKLYAFWTTEGKVKIASKGARLTAEQIERVASGETILYQQDAPTMNILGQTSFMRRSITSTVKNAEAF